MQGRVLPLAYTKSFATVVLATLSVLGAPVLPEAAAKAKDRLRFLCIGLGGGSVPSFFAETLPHCEVDVVELEPAVVSAATEGMGFVERPNLRVTAEDGVAFALRAVQEAEATGGTGAGVYDAVLVDAYDPDGNVPAPLWSRQQGLCTALEQGLLRPCGLVATNFLPHVDLAPALTAYGEALDFRGHSRGFSIQANKPAEKGTDDIEKIFSAVEGSGNRIAVRMCGGPRELAEGPLSMLEQRLEEEAVKVGKATGCLWDMRDLVSRGLREWPKDYSGDYPDP